MGSIIGQRVDYGGAGSSERPAAHLRKKKLTQVPPPALALPKLLQLLIGLDCLPSVLVIPISDGSGFLPRVVFSMAFQTGESS